MANQSLSKITVPILVEGTLQNVTFDIEDAVSATFTGTQGSVTVE